MSQKETSAGHSPMNNSANALRTLSWVRDLLFVALIGLAYWFLQENITASHEDLRRGISELRAEVKADISELRTEVKADISALRQDMRAEISSVRSDIVELRHEQTDVRVDLSERVAKLETRHSG